VLHVESHKFLLLVSSWVIILLISSWVIIVVATIATVVSTLAGGCVLVLSKGVNVVIRRS
jgi:hypothetical protein